MEEECFLVEVLQAVKCWNGRCLCWPF